MKKTFNLFLLLLISGFAFAQEEIKIEEITKAMSKGVQNGYSTEIPQTKLKVVISAWKKYVKRETKNNVEEANNELIIRGTKIPNISSNPVYIYARMLETDINVRLTAFFSEDDSVFISSQNTEDKSIAIKKFIREFAVQQYKSAVKLEQDAEKKKLAALENNIEDLILANEKSTKRIHENERKIEKCKDDIAANRKEQEARAGEVANQKEVVRNLSGSKSEDKTASEKKLKSLEKEKKKLEKKNDSLHDDIEDLQSDIHEQERAIEKTTELQGIKKEEATKQKEVIRNVDLKLSSIK